MINIIDSFDDARLDVFARESEAKLLNLDKPEDGMFIAESPKVVRRALDAGYEPVSLLLEQKHIDGEAKDIIERCPDIPVFTAQFDVLTRITGFELTRGVLCAMKRKPLPSVEDILEKSKKTAVLENVMNPTNVGAIIRSAAALGADSVLITDDSCDPLYRRAVRVSMGTVFQIPWTVADRHTYIDSLKMNSFTLYATALTSDSVSLGNISENRSGKTAVILGSEGDGLKPETIKRSDYSVIIPMTNNVDSLNVAAASAVVFWELFK